LIRLGSLEAGLMADFLGTPATMVIRAVICVFAAPSYLHVIRERESQAGCRGVSNRIRLRRYSP
jgi:hypothetical protein